MHILTWLSITVAWMRGGHTERLGAAVLLLELLVSSAGDRWWRIRDIEMVAVTLDVAWMLIFAWLALRADRWWPLVVTALLVLIVMARVIGLVNPELTRVAMLSATTGFWILLYSVVIAGVAERWLAGEAAISDGKTWRRRSP